MRLNEFNGKEIVNLNDGSRLGVIGDCDLIINKQTGKIEYLVIPNRRNQFSFLKDNSSLEVPWESIKKVSSELVIIEI
ncbi:MAG: hypothetical protein PWQ82_1775 [Thermosediminibacterales bacterium]|nr:hypothetical protein [Thermosediminibacterales bacterium]MDK2836357.1 hypothetical protein [Thermosediminibacterales bacterium]